MARTNSSLTACHLTNYSLPGAFIFHAIQGFTKIGISWWLVLIPGVPDFNACALRTLFRIGLALESHPSSRQNVSVQPFILHTTTTPITVYRISEKTASLFFIFKERRWLRIGFQPGLPQNVSMRRLLCYTTNTYTSTIPLLPTKQSSVGAEIS